MTNVNQILYGMDLFGEANQRPGRGPVSDKFLFPPFSVFDARSGAWQERRRLWIELGIKHEVVGRNKELVFEASRSAAPYWQQKMGKAWTDKDVGTSVFDPVLCECIYLWFSQTRDQILDPFAGGAVRGIVAGMLEREYWGCELRSEQIESNQEQAQLIVPTTKPKWNLGDANELLLSAPKSDLIFSCPPYGNLEKYSEDPRDLSNMSTDKFLETYYQIISKSANVLSNNRFACFVVSNFRDNKGFYINLVSHTIQAFEAAGLKLYNDAILITPVGSASLRVTKQFEAGRKLVKTHQNVLIFLKGDWKTATQHVKGSDGEMVITADS